MNIGTDKSTELDKYELNAAIAEHLMGMARGHCCGTIGGGNISGSGWQQEIHTWFICQWCGRVVEDGRGGGPCPKYPFPEIGTLQIMEALGKRGLHAFVRYDPLREGDNWTVMVGRTGRTDTDDPLRWLRVQALTALAKLSENDGGNR
jgi:hypothetical protein